MSSGMKVTIILPTKHRLAIKIPSKQTLVRQLLEEACLKKSLDPDHHQLRRNSKVLDNSISLLHANIPNLAEIELIEIDTSQLNNEAEKPIKVAVQPEGGTRIINEYASNTKLSEIIEEILSKGHVEKKVANGTIPTIIYMRKEITGNDLETTTLKSLGLTGGMSAALRFSYKQSESVNEQANVFVPAPKLEPSVKEEVAHRPMRKNNEVTLSDILPPESKNEMYPNEKPFEARNIENESESRLAFVSDENVIDNFQPNNMKDKLETKNQSSKNTTINGLLGQKANETKDDVIEPEILHYLDSLIADESKHQRNAIVFRIGANARIKHMSDNVTDEFFELNLNDIKLLHADNIKKAREAEEGAQLMTQQLRDSQAEGQKLNLINKYRRCIVRVQFPPPDKLVLQGTFSITETVEDVVRFVQNFLQDKNTAFDLFTTPPKKILDTKASLLDQNCFPAALLHFGPKKEYLIQNDAQLHYLNDNLLPLLSNGLGVEQTVSQAGLRRNATPTYSRNNDEFENTGSEASSSISSMSKSSTAGATKRSGSNTRNQEVPTDKKIPKWFKPGKPNPS